MEKNNSKQIILSIVAVLVLVIAVVGVSYAMYTFSATGTRTSSISTSQLSIAFSDETVATLTNQYPMTDAKGHSTNTNYYTFTVVPTLASGVTFTYVLYFTEVSQTGDLDETKINFVEVDANGKAVEGYGSCSGTGDTEAACLAASGTWTLAPKVLGSYMSATNYFASRQITTAANETFRIQFWVDDTYDLTTNDNTTSNDTISNTTTAATYTFKVNVQATA